MVSNAIWIKYFVDSLNSGIPSKLINAFCGNKFAILLIKNEAHNSKGKHIDLDYHYIHDIVERGEIKVHFISSIEMSVDYTTKGLTLDKFRVHVAVRLRNTKWVSL